MKIFELKNVSLIREQEKLLDTINWTVEKGQHWALLGLNGAGKSLLLQTVYGELWPSSGSATVLGQTFGQTSMPDLKKRIGWVSAAVIAGFPKYATAEKIVLSGLFNSLSGIYQHYTAQDLALAEQTLQDLGAKKLIGKSFSVMSQGQKQTVAIARALISKPELLILDEPCTGLDLFAREDLLEKIQELAELPNSPTLLMVTHHTEEILPLFSNVIMLKAGKVFGQGARKEQLTVARLSEFYHRPVKLQEYGADRVTVLPALL